MKRGAYEGTVALSSTSLRAVVNPAPIVVMQSFRAPRASTNPYITQLDRALANHPGIVHRRFSWWGALLGRYDVFQWHWPEGKLEGSTRWRAAAKTALTAAISVRHSMSRRIVVMRTVHNIELPDVGPVRTWLLRRIEAQADHQIVLNPTTPGGRSVPKSLIPHGHYRDWFASYPHSMRVFGQVGVFGAVRRYKSLDQLFDAYETAASQDHRISLRIGGRPTSSKIEHDVVERAASLPRVRLDLHFLSDAELVDIVTSSDVIVLAYRFMHNSGAVLAALSLGRPVLVPRNEVNEGLAREVGKQWVLMYDETLTADDLSDAIVRARDLYPDEAPDLSARDWDHAGRLHENAYREALMSKRGDAKFLCDDALGGTA